MTTVAIVQARLRSSRLPGKVLFEIAGRPMIGLVLERLTRAKKVDRIVLATGDDPENDAVEEVVHSLGFDVYRGPVVDVLARYAGAAEAFGADVIVRVTGDCPLLDPQVVDRIVQARADAACDYATNVKPPTLPDGLDVSVFTRDILNTAHAEAQRPSDREHVVPWMWRHTPLEGGTRFNGINVAWEEDCSALRWTVDEAADYRFLRALVAAVGSKEIVAISWRDILALVRANPKFSEMNNKIERDEGLLLSLARENKEQSS